MLLKFLKNISYFVLSIGDAICMSYIVYQLYGFHVFCLVFFSFILVSCLFMEGVVFNFLKKLTKLSSKFRESNVNKIIFIILLSGVVVYSSFVFRMNVLYLSGLFLHIGLSWSYIYFMFGVITISACFFGSVLLVDIFSLISEIDYKNMFLFIPSYFITEVVVSMLWRGVAGFGQVFINFSVINISFYLESILFLIVMLMVFDFLKGAVEAVCAFFTDDKGIDLYNLVVFSFVIVKSWATGVGMKSLTNVKLMPSNILGFFMDACQCVANSNIDNTENIDNENLHLPAYLFADVLCCMVAVNFFSISSVIVLNSVIVGGGALCANK